MHACVNVWVEPCVHRRACTEQVEQLDQCTVGRGLDGVVRPNARQAAGPALVLARHDGEVDDVERLLPNKLLASDRNLG